MYGIYINLLPPSKKKPMPDKSDGKASPDRVRLRQKTVVSCDDIHERCDYINKCMQQRQPVDMRQVMNLFKLTEMYNQAVSRKTA